MASITFAIDDDLKSKLSKFLWVNFSELARQELLRRQQLIEKLKSKEEQELLKWSVELGRRAKKDSFKKLLLRLPKERREELLKLMPPDKKNEYE